MKYLFYAGSTITMPHIGVLLNEAIRLRQNGHEIVWVVCNAKCQSCISNLNANPVICKHCNARSRRFIHKYGNSFQVVGLFNSWYAMHDAIFDNLQALKMFSYENSNIGYAIASAYISATRNPTIDFTNRHKEYFSKLCQYTIERFNNFNAIVQKYSPDSVILFNGRYFDTAICVEIAKKYNIDYIIKEVVDGPRCMKPFYIETYENHSVFDLKYKLQRILYTWDNSPLSKLEKERIAFNFYRDKRKGRAVVDKSYVSSQIPDLLPSNWDKNKHNIVIFNSSEDEIASIGADYESYTLFQSQYLGIVSILNEFKFDDNIKFYLRMHPNLKGLNNRFVEELYQLSQMYSNISVIRPEDTISSYSLIDAADKIITFGSTVGVEANFWGKPSILLSASEYYFLNVCYVPNTENELYKLIRSELLPKDRLGALQYAYYVIDRSVRCHQSTFVDITYQMYNIFGYKKLYTYGFDAICGSSLLSRIISLFYRKILSLFYKDSNPMPDRQIMDNI